MAKKSTNGGQPADGGKPKSKQAATKEAADALACAAEAHGLDAAAIPWGSILPILIRLIEALAGAGGIAARATR